MTRLEAFSVSPDLPAGPLGLRERRREQTNVEISETALTLFEHKGVEGTTVGEIAQTAGVSQRTFFRYFATKEEAALRDHWAFEAVLAGGLDQLDSEVSPRLALETAFAAALTMYSDSSSIACRRLLRVNRLIKKEPALRAELRARVCVGPRRLSMWCRRGSTAPTCRFDWQSMCRSPCSGRRWKRGWTNRPSTRRRVCPKSIPWQGDSRRPDRRGSAGAAQPARKLNRTCRTGLSMLVSTRHTDCQVPVASAPSKTGTDA